MHLLTLEAFFVLKIIKQLNKNQTQNHYYKLKK